MDRDTTTPDSLCLLRTLNTLPQLFIFHVLKVSNSEEDELHGQTAAKDVMCHMKHPLQQFKPLLCSPYPIP